MTDTSSNTDDRNHEPKSSRGWLLFPLMALSLFPLIALLTYDWRAMECLQIPAMPHSNWIGALGDNFAYISYQAVGIAAWMIPFACIGLGIRFALRRGGGDLRRAAWFAILLVSASSLAQLAQTHAPGITALLRQINIANAGGIIGYFIITRTLSPLISDFGAAIIMVILLEASLVAMIGARNIGRFFAATYRWTISGGTTAGGGGEADDNADTLAACNAAKLAKEAAKAAAKAEKERIRAEKAAAKEAAKAARAANRIAAGDSRTTAAVTSAEPPKAPRNPEPRPKVPTVRPTAPDEAARPEDKGPYTLPPISLLNPIPKSTADHGDVKEMSKKLIDTLMLFNIRAEISYTVQGPVVTTYAVELEPGTKYSAVTNISDNLKGALHAMSLLIEAPIPGESAVGIQVPNRSPAGISFREIFESSAFQDSKAELPLLFGKDAAGKELVADLASMPHMLVAGATGQGKSVCLNSIINGLLMSRTPEQLKLIMVDPKSVEFTAYTTIPHLIVPVITDNRKVVYSLHWAVVEMEKRLKMFARARVKNIKEFNSRDTYTQIDMFGNDEAVNSDMPRTVPYIVIIIDEVADLMAAAAKEVVPDISRLTAKARAAGIHLILATQRPDAKVITGTIKANIPGRVAFKTATSIDSRTILDDTGAENLIGRGDMLFKSKDGQLIRAQGALISDPEIDRITKFIAEHATTQFDETFAKKLSRVKETDISDPFADNPDDPDNHGGSDTDAPTSREMVKAAANADDFKKAVECVINTNRASVSHFQRQMGWGYNHAAKILDMLEAKGIVSPQSGMGPRQIIMERDQMQAILNGDDEPTAPTTAMPDQAGGDIGQEQFFTTEQTEEQI